MARFWAAVLDDYRVAAYDPDELDRLRAMGIIDIDDDPSVLVEPVSGAGPRLFFQLVPDGKQAKNRLHLDLSADDVDTEIDRLAALGARVLSEHPGHVVMADVEDNEFCVLRRQTSESVTALAGERL